MRRPIGARGYSRRRAQPRTGDRRQGRGTGHRGARHHGPQQRERCRGLPVRGPQTTASIKCGLPGTYGGSRFRPSTNKSCGSCRNRAWTGRSSCVFAAKSISCGRRGRTAHADRGVGAPAEDGNPSQYGARRRNRLPGSVWKSSRPGKRQRRYSCFCCSSPMRR